MCIENLNVVIVVKEPHRTVEFDCCNLQLRCDTYNIWSLRLMAD